MPLPEPPLDRCMKGFNPRGVSLVENAKEIDVRMFGVKLPCHGGPVQSHGFQIPGSGSFQFLDEFIQVVVHRSLLLHAMHISPASAGPAASKRSSSESSKTTTAAAEAATAPGASAIPRASHPRSAAAGTYPTTEHKPE